MDIITATIVSTFAKKVGDSAFSVVKTKLTSLQNSNKFNRALETYITISSKKIEKVKTLFYDSVPKNIYDFYQPLNLAKNSGHFEQDEEVINTSSVAFLMEKYGNLLIVGHGGSGKTFLFKYLFLNSVSEYYKIPIYLELRNYNEYNGSFINYLYDSLKNSGFEIEKDFFLETLKSDQYIFFLDAFDEVYPDKQNALSIEIKNFCNRYSGNKFVLSCRFSEGFNDWSFVSEYRMLGLKKEDAIALVSKIDIEQKWKSEFINDLSESLYMKYESFASSPLLLNIMLLTYGATSTLPDKLDKFYEKAFESLFYSHDLSKNRFRRKLESELTYEQIKKIFSRICFKTYQKSQYTFTFDELITIIEFEKRKETSNNKIQEVDSQKLLHDLEINLCMFVKDGFNYHFVHRSFQEYFAATFIDNRNEIDQKKIFPILLEKKPITGFSDDLENFWEIMFQINPERFIDNAIFNQINNLFTQDIGPLEFFLDMYSEITYSPATNDSMGLALGHNKNSRYRSITILFIHFITKFSKKEYPSKIVFSREKNKEVNDSIDVYLQNLSNNRTSSFSLDSFTLVSNDLIKNIITTNAESWWGTYQFPLILEWKENYILSRDNDNTNFLDEI